MIIGVDVGGTFTDVFFLDEASQKIEIAKVPSTPEDSSRGFLQGLVAHAKDWSRVRTVVHGTTVGTNALLSRKGAKTGILTTRGFRDVLEMRRRDRPPDAPGGCSGFLLFAWIFMLLPINFKQF